MTPDPLRAEIERLAEAAESFYRDMEGVALDFRLHAQVRRLGACAQAVREALRSTEERTCPIQIERGASAHPLRIPWSMAQRAYSVYAGRYGTGQSLDRIAERGGFAPSEMDKFLPGWREEATRPAARSPEPPASPEERGLAKLGLKMGDDGWPARSPEAEGGGRAWARRWKLSAKRHGWSSTRADGSPRVNRPPSPSPRQPEETGEVERSLDTAAEVMERVASALHDGGGTGHEEVRLLEAVKRIRALRRERSKK